MRRIRHLLAQRQWSPQCCIRVLGNLILFQCHSWLLSQRWRRENRRIWKGGDKEGPLQYGLHLEFMWSVKADAWWLTVRGNYQIPWISIQNQRENSRCEWWTCIDIFGGLWLTRPRMKFTGIGGAKSPEKKRANDQWEQTEGVVCTWALGRFQGVSLFKFPLFSLLRPSLGKSYQNARDSFLIAL